jgi:hypothetical protein
MLWRADLQIFTEESKGHIEKPRSALPGSAILRGLTDPENKDIKIFQNIGKYRVIFKEW